MLKRWMILLLALLVFPAGALAEVYSGTTVALSSVTVRADKSGVVEAVSGQVGQRVEAGDALLRLKSEKTFASQDGTVSLVNAGEGDAVAGSVLEIAPVERYTLHCTVDKAYQSAASTLVHSGETLYVKCTADGTHRAIGVVTQIDGDEYRVMTIGGELYVGETVYLYRDTEFTTAQRVGIGTVVVSDTQSYEADGRLTRLCVAAGDAVERGQLLYETGGGDINAPVGGILTSLSLGQGEAAEVEQVVAEIVPDSAICVAVQLDETAVARVTVGDTVSLMFAGQEDEDAISGTVTGLSAIAESGNYTVYIAPETSLPLSLGMSVEARFENI